MTGEALTKEELLPLFEAARWAPSCYNDQPWRFHYALRGTAGFDRLFALLVDANKAWCEKAGALMVLPSHTLLEHNGKPMRTHSHDAGAAWHALAIEGVRRNLVVHGMAGFDYKAAQDALDLGSNSAVECMIAVGKPAEGASEEAVSSRKAIDEIAVEVG